MKTSKILLTPPVLYTEFKITIFSHSPKYLVVRSNQIKIKAVVTVGKIKPLMSGHISSFSTRE